MMSNCFLFIGSTELIVIAAITLLLFGGKKVPELMKGLGQGVRDFKKGIENLLMILMIFRTNKKTKR